MKTPRHPRQLRLQSFGHGGAREGAGRPPKTGKAKHQTRPEISDKIPLHITVRLRKDMPSMRTKKAFKLFRKAVIRARLQGLRVLEFAVLGNHWHFLAEADSKLALSRGMRSLNIQIAKGLKKLSGALAMWVAVQDRYDAKLLKTPTQVRNALTYIFANAAKHFKRREVFDWYCSFSVFNGPLKILKTPEYNWSRPELTLEQQDWLLGMLSEPRSWMARYGWQRAARR